MNKQGTSTSDFENRVATLKVRINEARSTQLRYASHHRRGDPVFAELVQQARLDEQQAENQLAALERAGPPALVQIPAKVAKDAAAAAKAFDDWIAAGDAVIGRMLEAAKRYGARDEGHWPNKRLLAPVISHHVLNLLRRHELPEQRSTETKPRPLQERF